jgi:type IV secretory pathway VirB10-like protein
METTPPIPPQEPSVTQRYQPPEGAIPVAKVKRVAIGLGILILVLLTIWGSTHKAPADVHVAAAPVLPTSATEIDSQQAEVAREMEEAKRAAQEAEAARQRAQRVPVGDPTGGPRNAQADPAAQLRAQLALDDVRRQHQAAFASTVAFAPQGSHAEPNAGSTPPAPAPAASPQRDQPLEPAPGTPPQGQAPEPPPGTYRLDEGTIIETILLNRLDGEFVGPVIAQVSADVYSRAGLELLIPKGSRLLGEAKNVNSFDQRRLAILFHRVILPNEKSLLLDKFRGLDQVGETGVVSKIDHHYLEIFGTSLALGAIGGLSQIGAYGSGGYDPSVGFRIGFTERMGSSAEQVLSKFLNKMPTIKVLEGTRIKVILTNDLNLEAYE